MGIKISRWHYKAFKAFCAFVALALILAMIYAQNQSYKYIVSHKALKVAYLQEDVEEMVTNSRGIWEWFEAVVERAKYVCFYVSMSYSELVMSLLLHIIPCKQSL